MADQESKAREIITSFLERAGKAPGELAPQTRLYGDGLELDSLEAAELSALLEDELGTDPFSAGDEMPETIGDILAFYAVPSGV
ncbi:MAG TPA: phosphopantetheine-binding protein [Jatrophihabitans sp.]|nr:phosphopantetheine-binding protein [Jatrophihabitans sp.]